MWHPRASLILHCSSRPSFEICFFSILVWNQHVVVLQGDCVLDMCRPQTVTSWSLVNAAKLPGNKRKIQKDSALSQDIVCSPPPPKKPCNVKIFVLTFMPIVMTCNSKALGHMYTLLPVDHFFKCMKVKDCFPKALNNVHMATRRLNFNLAVFFLKIYICMYVCICIL